MKKALLIVAAVVVLGAFWLVQSRSDVESPESPRLARAAVDAPPSVQVEDVGAEVRPVASPREPISTRAPTVPPASLSASLPALPDRSLPFAQQLDALIERAGAGDPVAACRLIVKASTCVAREHNREFAARMQQSVLNNGATGSDELMVRAIAQNENEAAASQGTCAGVDVKTIPSPDAYLERAASALSVRQKVLLAMVRLDGSLARLPREGTLQVRTARSIDELVPQFFADHDLQFLREGLEAADPLALEGLILVHAPGRLPRSSEGMRISLPNPYQFALHARLMEQLYGPSALGLPVADLLSRTMASLDSATLNRLDRDIDARTKQWHARAGDAAPLEMTIEEPDSLCEGP